MKKALLGFALVLLLTTSVIAGTLAMYTTSIDNLAEGSVVAKEFILTEGGTDTFTKNVKIAPNETVNWQFSVMNYNGSIISETAMNRRCRRRGQKCHHPACGYRQGFKWQYRWNCNSKRQD